MTRQRLPDELLQLRLGRDRRTGCDLDSGERHFAEPVVADADDAGVADRWMRNQHPANGFRQDLESAPVDRAVGPAVQGDGAG